MHNEQILTFKRKEKRPHIAFVSSARQTRLPQAVFVLDYTAWESFLNSRPPSSRPSSLSPSTLRTSLSSFTCSSLTMESGSQKLLESAAQKTLHAHAFSRSSSQASLVLTDLLSRYLALLTSTCTKYAQHAGRTGLTVRDAIGALNDLGVSIEELSEYCSSEGKELNRYALHSTRRVEDLNEFKGQSLSTRTAQHIL